MLISKYSAPEFDPYGNDDPIVDDGPWPAPTATSAVSASVSVPGSKSLTNRELVLAALADSPSRLIAPLHARDTTLMIDGLRSLGAVIRAARPDAHADTRTSRHADNAEDLVVEPGELHGSTTIDCGLAGTVMRFLPPVAGLGLGPTTFDGDAAARRRPMRTTITALRDLGVDVDDDRRGALPFTVHGSGRIRGGDLVIDASTSSQFVSGLLLAAPRFEEGLHLRHAGENLPSLPHIEMTVAALRARGVRVHSPGVGEWVVEAGPIAARDTMIEPDLSNAAPFLAAAVATGGRVRIEGWPEQTTQVGARLADLLAHFGATIERGPASLTVTGPDRISAADLDLSDAGELAPNLVALAALADGPSEFTGIGHIRHHETDRLAALAAEINNLGGGVTVRDDGLSIEPAPLSGGTWRSHADHRMATTGAILGLVVPGILIEDIACTAKTMPRFVSLWHRMLGRTDAASAPATTQMSIGVNGFESETVELASSAPPPGEPE